MTEVSTVAYCGHCGLPQGDPEGPDTTDSALGEHATCRRRLELEPPRYCPTCRRRMVVQVTPGRWTARCVEHGETAASTWD